MSGGRPWRLPQRDRLAAGVLRRLGRVGIEVTPFLVVREPPRADADRSGLAGLDVGFVGPEWTDELVRLEPSATREEVTGFFAAGKLCFAVRDGSRVLAKTWCDLDEINYGPARRPLEHDEAYLFAAFADPALRGRRLAPAMRAATYDALRDMGRTRFWSYTDLFNPSARRFKRALGAHDDALRLYVSVRGRWSRTVTLRRYPPPTAPTP
jgi:GNAT superfamily N-acetyltransferase